MPPILQQYRDLPHSPRFEQLTCFIWYFNCSLAILSTPKNTVLNSFLRIPYAILEWFAEITHAPWGQGHNYSEPHKKGVEPKNTNAYFMPNSVIYQLHGTMIPILQMAKMSPKRLN